MYIKTIAISAIVLIVLDSIFIYTTSKIFTAQIVDVQHSPLQVNKFGAVFVYVLLIFALNYFILQRKGSVFDAFLLGVSVYGVYEGTNVALLKKWQWKTVVMDTVWGGILLALTTYFTYFFQQNIIKIR